jgi:hypothetical protein
MDASIVTFLSGLRISPELAAFVALVVLFLIFIWRSVKFGVEKFTASQSAIAAVSDRRLEEMSSTVERIADKFQVQLDRFETRGFDSQMRFQEQIRSLTETNVAVNREHIAALTGIQAAFQGQAMRLETVERIVGEIGRSAIVPPGRARSTTTRVVAEEVSRVIDPPPRPPVSGPADPQYGRD